MTNRFKLVIFDWDGTLIDSTRFIVACIQQAFAELDLPVPNKKKSQSIIGLGLREAITELCSEANESLVELVAASYRKHFLKKEHNREDLFSGTLTTLNILKTRGYKMAIATGKGRMGLEKVLTTTQLNSYFDSTRCADETRSKPHPQMLREILLDLSLEPEDSVMIGDTEYDLEMAAAINIPAIAASYGAHSMEQLCRHQHIAYVDKISAITNYL